MPVQEQKMERATISFPEKQLEKIDGMVSSGEYPNRSEVVRTALREFHERHTKDPVSAHPNEQSPVMVAS